MVNSFISLFSKIKNTRKISYVWMGVLLCSGCSCISERENITTPRDEFFVPCGMFVCVDKNTHLSDDRYRYSRSIDVVSLENNNG